MFFVFVYFVIWKEKSANFLLLYFCIALCFFMWRVFTKSKFSFSVIFGINSVLYPIFVTLNRSLFDGCGFSITFIVVLFTVT